MKDKLVIEIDQCGSTSQQEEGEGIEVRIDPDVDSLKQALELSSNVPVWLTQKVDEDGIVLDDGYAASDIAVAIVQQIDRVKDNVRSSDPEGFASIQQLVGA